ncbi:hypothetical protein [Brucella sp. IR073]|uniref:hypothetical protein n=1 Tax=unclassified Brucella TaxID=2632610 RepID=UPI003B982236
MTGLPCTDEPVLYHAMDHRQMGPRDGVFLLFAGEGKPSSTLRDRSAGFFNSMIIFKCPQHFGMML